MNPVGRWSRVELEGMCVWGHQDMLLKKTIYFQWRKRIISFKIRKWWQFNDTVCGIHSYLSPVDCKLRHCLVMRRIWILKQCRIKTGRGGTFENPTPFFLSLRWTAPSILAHVSGFSLHIGPAYVLFNYVSCRMMIIIFISIYLFSLLCTNGARFQFIPWNQLPNKQEEIKFLYYNNCKSLNAV